MAEKQAKGELVTFGGCSASVTERSGGGFQIYWREAGRPRNTTRMDKGEAKEFARKKVRELAGKTGMRSVAVIDAEAIEELKGLIGGRSLAAVVEQLGDAVQRLGGWEHVQRSMENYLKAGHGKLDRSTVLMVVERFLKLHDRPDGKEYRRGLKKELHVFAKAYPDLSIADIDEDLLKGWIGRRNLDGTRPGWRYFNNRLATWKTFLNQCRKWKMRVQDEEHPGETIQPMKKVDSTPPIWEVPLARKILQVVMTELNESLAYLVMGCWMGLRPFEEHRILPEKFNWERGYLGVDADVARKVMSERFVPIPDNVRALLYERVSKGKAFWSGRGRSGLVPFNGLTRADDQVYLSQLLREKGLIVDWEQDVMRHSCISHRLAQGHGRGQVAEWSGNSEREIRKSYRKPLMREEGVAWFEIGL